MRTDHFPGLIDSVGSGKDQLRIVDHGGRFSHREGLRKRWSVVGRGEVYQAEDFGDAWLEYWQRLRPGEKDGGWSVDMSLWPVVFAVMALLTVAVGVAFGHPF